jgi:hypothetical protein
VRVVNDLLLSTSSTLFAFVLGNAFVFIVATTDGYQSHRKQPIQHSKPRDILPHLKTKKAHHEWSKKRQLQRLRQHRLGRGEKRIQPGTAV